jgi:adenylate kinase family enzyme
METKRTPSRIIIFGRPGSGKSTFALQLHNTTKIPLYHLDAYFYVANWQERNYEEFLGILQRLIEKDEWIIDGNYLESLEIRYSNADIVLYFNYPRWLCFARILKRFFKRNRSDALAQGCKETVKFRILKYMWNFEKRIKADISVLNKNYPHTIFREIKSDKDLKKILELFNAPFS